MLEAGAKAGTFVEIKNSRIGELLGGGVVPVPRGSESYGLVPDRAFATMDREVFVTVRKE